MKKSSILIISIAAFILLAAIAGVFITVNKAFSEKDSQMVVENNGRVYITAQMDPSGSGSPPPSSSPDMNGGVPPVSSVDASSSSVASGQKREFSYADPFAGGPDERPKPPPAAGGAVAKRPYNPVYEMPGVNASTKSGVSSGGRPSTGGGSTGGWGAGATPWGRAIDEENINDAAKVVLAQRFGWLNDSNKIVAVILKPDGDYSVASVGAVVDGWVVTSIDRDTLTLKSKITGEKFNVYSDV